MARPNVGDRFAIGAVGTAETSDVLTGKTFSSEPAGVEAAGAMANKGSFSETVSHPNDSFSDGAGYYSGVSVNSDIVDRGSENVTPGTTNQSFPSGYYSGVTVQGDGGLASHAIRNGRTIFSVSGDFRSSATLRASGGSTWANLSGTTDRDQVIASHHLTGHSVRVATVGFVSVGIDYSADVEFYIGESGDLQLMDTGSTSSSTGCLHFAGIRDYGTNNPSDSVIIRARITNTSGSSIPLAIFNTASYVLVE